MTVSYTHLADSGSIVYKGTEVSGKSTDSLAKMGIIRTFQNIKLFTSMSALENTMVGGHSFTGNSMAKSLLDVRAHFREEKLLKEAAEEDVYKRQEDALRRSRKSLRL